MSWRTWFSLAVFLLSLGSVVRLQSHRLHTLQRAAAQPTLTQISADLAQQRQRLAVLRSLPTLGFDNLFADWTLLQFFQYFGDDAARQQTGYELTLDYFAIVVQHHPRLLDIYPILATAGAMYAVDPQKTDQLLAQGIAHLTPEMPRHAYIAVQNKAVNELLFLPNGGDRAQHTFTQAAAWAGIYDDAPSQRAATFARNIAQLLQTNPDSNKVRIMAWTSILQTVADERSQQRAIAAIRALGGDLQRQEDGTVKIRFPDEPSLPGSAPPAP